MTDSDRKWLRCCQLSMLYASVLEIQLSTIATVSRVTACLLTSHLGTVGLQPSTVPCIAVALSANNRSAHRDTHR